MIHGTGLLASAFRTQYPDTGHWTVFARGVSNSAETDAAAFDREQALLISCLSEAGPVVYFSSCALVNPPAFDTPYLAHKRRMEALVLEANAGNRVFRLPQVVGNAGNANTLTNFLRDNIVSGTPFTIWGRAERNLMDVDDVVAIAWNLMHTPDAQRVIDIVAEQSLPMPEIVALFERVLECRGTYEVQDKGDPLQVKSRRAVEAARRLGIDLGPASTERILRKYYGN